jgi:phospholipid/cholesterol/gamma-HCH transport system substrate-binding protein
MTRTLMARMAVLALIVVASVYFIAFDAVGVKLWWNQPYTVHVDLPNAGGIYTDASVTYRGVGVGKVSGVHLKRNMVVIDLAIRHGEKIPANVTASVKELTAASEQYVDLAPTSSDPPYLTPGYTIPEDRTSVPVTIGQLLNQADALINSLHASDLNTISQTLGQGLQNAGQDLRSIIIDGKTLLQALQSVEGGTVSLIVNGNTVLNTLNDTSNEFTSFSNNLQQLTAQLVQSNSDIVHLLQNGTTASTALDNFLKQTGQPTADLINNMATITGLAYANEPAFKALTEVLPLFATNIAATASGGNTRFELDFNTQNTVCPYTTQMAEPTSLVATADLTRNCNIQAPDLLQRGADKAPAPTGG